MPKTTPFAALTLALLAVGCDAVTLNPIGLERTLDHPGGAGGSGAGGGDAGSDASTGDSAGAGGHASDAGTDAHDGGHAPADAGPIVAVQVVTGERHTCALLSDGTVKCWGASPKGQLGYGNQDTIGNDELPSSVGVVSVTNEPGVRVKQLAAGWQHTCALLTNSTVQCWGENDQGQLGYGNTVAIGDDELPSSVGPVSVSTTPGVHVLSITAGRHTCALLSDHTVTCWGPGTLGYENSGAIGDDELPSSAGPISVTTLPDTDVSEIFAGFFHTCATLSDSTAKCWGDNTYGQLGIGSRDSIGDDELPSSIGALRLVTNSFATPLELSGGYSRTCARLSDGSVVCWGSASNGSGGIGYGDTRIIGDDELPYTVGPVSLTTTPGVTATALGGGAYHACAVLSDQSVKCWGENHHGQLGLRNVDTIGDDELPSSVGSVNVTNVPDVHVTALASGNMSLHTCALLSNGTVQCWGFGGDGQLGIGRIDDIGDDEVPSSAGPVVLF